MKLSKVRNFDINPNLMAQLKDTFYALVGKYNPHTAITDALWDEIEKQYTSAKRFYHNLNHLEFMLAHLEQCREVISDWDTVLFSLFYHDIIYKATSKENEEKSALVAIKALQKIDYPSVKIRRCGEQILATKTHEISKDNDTNLFTDADLAILGTLPETYTEYSRNVRREYSVYPDFMYNPGRKKVLQHFLDMDFIFKTKHFRELYEVQARKNIATELSNIS